MFTQTTLKVVLFLLRELTWFANSLSKQLYGVKVIREIG